MMKVLITGLFILTSVTFTQAEAFGRGRTAKSKSSSSRSLFNSSRSSGAAPAPAATPPPRPTVIESYTTITNTAVSSASFRYRSSHNGLVGVRFSKGVAVISVIRTGGADYQYVVPQEDGLLITNSDYNAQNATITLSCNNGGVRWNGGWVMNASCRLNTLTYKK